MLFRKFIETDDFLSLSSEEVINLISCNDINVPFEEKVCLLKFIIVFDCIIWEVYLSVCKENNRIK